MCKILWVCFVAFLISTNSDVPRTFGMKQWGGGGRGIFPQNSSMSTVPQGGGVGGGLYSPASSVLFSNGSWGLLFVAHCRGRLKRTARAVQLFGCLAMVETHTLWYFGHHYCFVVGFDALGIWHFWIFALFHPFLPFCTHFFAHFHHIYSFSRSISPHHGDPEKARVM